MKPTSPIEIPNCEQSDSVHLVTAIVNSLKIANVIKYCISSTASDPFVRYDLEIKASSLGYLAIQLLEEVAFYFEQQFPHSIVFRHVVSSDCDSLGPIEDSNNLHFVLVLKSTNKDTFTEITASFNSLLEDYIESFHDQHRVLIDGVAIEQRRSKSIASEGYTGPILKKSHNKRFSAM